MKPQNHHRQLLSVAGYYMAVSKTSRMLRVGSNNPLAASVHSFDLFRHPAMPHALRNSARKVTALSSFDKADFWANW